MAASSSGAEAKPDYTGWVAGLVIVLAVLSVGAGVWIHFHG